MNNIYISIITLTKNDTQKFFRTLKSLKSQTKDFVIEWIIVDGSGFSKYEINKKLIHKNFSEENNNFIIKHLNVFKKNISGIYSCMNYGKRLANGKFMIFLNSGDIFYSYNSLKIFYQNTVDVSPHKSIIFGQANIFSSDKLNWLFPGKRLKNIERWLRIFEPNHQSMLISGSLAKNFDFNEKYNLIADGKWKRIIIKNAIDIIYIKTPLVIFFLDGLSSIKPSPKNLKDILKNNNITLFRKIIFTTKYLIPEKFFIIYYHLQKYKSLLVDLLL